jgi:SAM-dependent methyltransferase
MQGRVLWIGDGSCMPGAPWPGGQITQLESLEALTPGTAASSESFDCIVCCGALERVYDPAEAIDALQTLLRPGGVLLATLAGSPTPSLPDRHDVYWGFTTASARRLFEGSFPADRLSVEVHGNVQSAAARLHGLGPEDLAPEALEHVDEDYQLVVTVRARKPEPV